MSSQPQPLTVLPPQRPHDSARKLNTNVIWLGRWLINVTLLGIADAIALSVALLVAVWIRTQTLGTMPQPAWFFALPPLWIVGAIGVRTLPGWGMGIVEELRRTVLLLVGLFTVITTFIFLNQESAFHSRLILGLTFPLAVPLMLLLRTQVKKVLIKTDMYGMQAVIFGTVDNARRIIRAIREEPGLGYRPIAVITREPHQTQSDINGVPVITDLKEDALYAQAAILAVPESSRHEQLEIVEGPLKQFRHILMIPDLQEAPSLWVQPRDVGGILGLEISCNLLNVWDRIIKRVLEATLVALSLPLFIVLLPVLALAVWLCDRRNPFFTQERIGRHGKQFRVWKFRTMHKDAEALLENALTNDDQLRAEWNRTFKLRHDPRITIVGRFLRRTSLDELPQIINVLRGEMSLVGPRPLPAYHHEQLAPRVQELRERVRPGITGLWQVTGRSESGNDGLNKWDAYYVRNWSLWLDIVILLRTIRAVFKGTGAY